ncbi:agmatine deiminase family protein [Mariniblastus sp.]|nr:agmatine deiminase family protein [Mariniblastus sp.]
MTCYRMPAEWQPQAATWVAWPHNTDTWPHNLAEAQSGFIELVQTIARCQKVFVLCGGPALQQARKAFPASNSNVVLVDIPTNDAWARDYAPTFVVDEADRQLIALDWHYNAWGGKYPPFDQDQQVAKKVAEHLRVECVSPKLCFEGGAIEINQSGVVLSTKSCALDPNRNAERSLEQVEQTLIESLGAKSVIWLQGDAIEGDDTDGHIDQLARFTDDNTIVYAWSEDKTDPQAARLQQNLTDLRSGLASIGREDARLIPLPLPEPVYFRDMRLPASYCNFVITNQQVIVPQFKTASDQRAMEILGPLFPDREVIGLPSHHLSVGLGSFHCLTQQQPQLGDAAVERISCDRIKGN